MTKKLWYFLNNSFFGLLVGVGLTIFQFWLDEKEYAIGYCVEVQTENVFIGDQNSGGYNSINADAAHTVNIALWNDGDMYMDKSVISSTDPLRIVPDSSVKIISYKILRTSRNNLHFTIIPRSGLIVKIKGDDGLEKYDGIKLQVVYYGPANTSWRIAGRIKSNLNSFNQYYSVDMYKFKSFPWFAMPLEIILIAIFSWIIIICHIYNMQLLTHEQLMDVFHSYILFSGLLVFTFIFLWNHIFYAGTLAWMF
ncbi:MAG: hypothetical protein J7497_08090 [Chitinophagaceae bacterium]|nr:hypothetical protein [Chitinophagaceae bacterium]